MLLHLVNSVLLQVAATIGAPLASQRVARVACASRVTGSPTASLQPHRARALTRTFI